MNTDHADPINLVKAFRSLRGDFATKGILYVAAFVLCCGGMGLGVVAGAGFAMLR